MDIGGFLKNSFVDYPGNISCVIFTSGCNFNCWYCHNKQLIQNRQQKYELSAILEFLKTRNEMIEGVVITGGEPTLQEDLCEVIKQIKQLNFKVKLDTNGSNPQILKQIIDDKLVDYIAMDIKTSKSKYNEITQCKIDTQSIEKSIDLIIQSGVEHEFRTTFAPDVTLSDIEKIAKRISLANKYFIQKYIPCEDNKDNVHRIEEYYDALDTAKKYNKNSFLRSI